MNSAVRSMAFRLLHDVVRRDGAGAAWAASLLFQHRSTEDQRVFQLEQLRLLLAHALRTVPHHRDRIASTAAEVGEWGWEEFGALPLLDKAEIRKAGNRLLSSDCDALGAVANATSGSTGESLHFWNDASHAVHRRAATYRFHGWCGVSPFDREAKLWGARFDAPKGGRLGRRAREWMHPSLFLSSYRMGEKESIEHLRRLHAFRPSLLTSYPSPLEGFAEFCRIRGEKIPSLRAIITSAEQLLPRQRASIESVFGVPVFDRYGSREFANVAQECEVHEGLHVATDRVWLEVLDQSGRPCAPGEVGELVITDLQNHVMPFLRYRTGDLGSWDAGECACGRTLPRLQSVQGRILDLVRTPSGRVVSGTFWPQAVKEASRRVRNFQVRQTRRDLIELVLQTEAATPLDEAEEGLLRGRIGQYAPDLQVRLIYVDDIAPTRGGKRRQVVNLVDTDPRMRPEH